MGPHPLKGGRHKVVLWNQHHRYPYANMNCTHHLQEHCSSYSLVDKGNSAQPTRQNSRVCAITIATYWACVAWVRSHSVSAFIQFAHFAWISGVGFTLYTCTEKHQQATRPEEARFGVAGIHHPSWGHAINTYQRGIRRFCPSVQ